MSIDEIMYKMITSGLNAIFLFSIVALIIGIGIMIAIVALITWVIKRVWYGADKPNSRPQHTKKTGDWLIDAQQRQQARYDYTDPPRAEQREPKSQEPKRYPSGWVFNEETGKWDPPDYLAEESRKKWRWDPEKGIWIDQEKEARLEKYRKNREGKPPNYEEWKAAKLAEEAARKAEEEQSKKNED